MILQALAGGTLLGLCLAAGGLSGAPPEPAGDPEARQAMGGHAADWGGAYFYFVSGRHLESAGDVEGAVKAYRQAAALDPRSAEIRAELAALYARQDRAREAIEWAETALKLDAENAEANRVLGIVFAGLARLDDESAAGNAESLDAAKKAVGHLETARRRVVSPDPSLDLMLGRLYMRTGNDEQAIATLRRLSEEEVDRAEPTALLAQAYVQAGRPQDAVGLLERAAATHPEFSASLGELYEKQQRWADAATAYEAALARNPRSVELRTRLAVALLSEGGAAEAGRAAATLEDARKLTPTDTQVLYLLAQAQRAAGTLDEAEATARQLAALAPAGPSAPYALAQIYDEKQQYRRVVETLEPALERATAAAAADTRWPAVALMLASAYQELGAFDRALATFARARILAPDNRNIGVYELGVLVSARRFGEALERSQALLSSHPGDQRVVRLRAEALRGAGRTGDAVALLKEAVAARPGEASSYLALSEMYAATGQFADAGRVLADAGRKFPSDPTVKFQMGSVLDREKRFAEAERVFREVLAQDPLYAPALNYLGYMLADRGERLEESVALIKRALAVEPYNGAYLDSLGWAYFKAGRLDLAEPLLRQASDQRLRDSAIQDHHGDLLFRLGRYGDAAAAWRKALDGDGEQIDVDQIGRKIRSADEKAAKR
jgi:tetratricopeptide (TPR) repeat protein